MQCFSEGFDGIDAGCILLPLDHADIVAIERCPVGKLLLCEPAFPPQSFKISRQILLRASCAATQPIAPGASTQYTRYLGVADSENRGGYGCGGKWLADRLDAGADVYVATLCGSGARSAHVIVRIPRSVVDDTVLQATEVLVEMAIDGRILVYADTVGMRSLASTSLGELISAALSPEALAAEERPNDMTRLEAELVRALELVRRARMAE